MLAEPLMVTLLVIDAFEKLNIPYLIGGSLASALHGTARSTLDTDLVADMRPEQVDPLVEMLQKVDVFIAKPRRFDQMQFQRRRLEIVANEPERLAYIATAELNVANLLQRALKESE